MSQKRRLQQQVKKSKNKNSFNENISNLIQNGQPQSINIFEREQHQIQSGNILYSLNIQESHLIENHDKNEQDMKRDKVQSNGSQKQIIISQNPTNSYYHENNNEGIQNETIKESSSQTSGILQQLNKSQTNNQLIAGSTQNIERKGILKNSQVVYNTELQKTIIPSQTAEQCKIQKDIIQIDKVQTSNQQFQNNQQNDHKQIQQQYIQKNCSSQQLDNEKNLNNIQINISTNPNNAYAIYEKIQNALINKNLNSCLQQPTLCGKEIIRSNIEIQKCMNQYFQSKLAKKQNQHVIGESIEIIHQLQNGKLDKYNKQQKQINDEIDLENAQYISNFHKKYKSEDLEINYEDGEDIEDENEEIEEDEEDELYEELEEDDDDNEDEIEEEIDEEIDQELDEDEIEEELKCNLQNNKFLHSDKMDIDGLGKKRLSMCQDKKNNTIILNIKAQNEYFEKYSQLLQTKKNAYKQFYEDSKQRDLLFLNDNNMIPNISSNTTCSTSRTYSTQREGVLASQILKDKQNEKHSEIKMQQHSIQFQKQIDSINNKYADTQKQIQQQLKQSLLLQQGQNSTLVQNQEHVKQQNNHDTSKHPSLNEINSSNNQNQNQINTNKSTNQQNSQTQDQVDKHQSQKNKVSESIQTKPCTENGQHQKQQQKQKHIDKIVFSTEIKNILDQLDHLSYQEKKKATTLCEQEFNIQMQNIIDCVGCKESLQNFLNDQIQLVQQTQKPINLDGIIINKNRELVSLKQYLIHLGIIDSLLENNFNIASFLQFHCNKSSMLENLNKNFSLFKKSVGQRSYRCHLHSKKHIPYLWKDNLEQLFDSETCSKDEVIEIDEFQFLSNLDKYLKKRKFCGTCKENIMGEYYKLKENVEMNQEEYMHDHYDEMIHNKDEKQHGQHSQCYEHHQHSHDYHQSLRQKSEKNPDVEVEYENGDYQTNEKISDAIHLDSRNNCAALPEAAHTGEDDDEEEYEDEVDEEEEEEEEDDEEDYDDQQYDLISCIKYCNKTRKISIPMQPDFIEEILNKAQIDTSLIKHANTTEAAQDELLICLGQTLKEKFQTVWKNKKSEEIVKQLFLNIILKKHLYNFFTQSSIIFLSHKKCFRVFMAQIQGCIQIALERQGCKNSLEEYLEEDERAKEAKKIKNQKKKQKQKIKKQEKKQEEQKKQMEEELKKKQEEELKQQQKLEAKLFKKQQEELLQKQKQIEEEQKKIKQQQSKKKKKGKKGSEQQSQNNINTEDNENQNVDNNVKSAEASPINKKTELNDNMYLQNSGSNCKQSTQSTLMNTAECVSSIHQAFDVNIDNDSYDSETEIDSSQHYCKKSNSVEPEFKTVQKEVSKRNKTHKIQYINQFQKSNATPINAAAAAGVLNQSNNQIINKDASAEYQQQIQRANNSQQVSFENSKTITDRERILLKQMGWNEEQEFIIEIPQTDIKHYSQNKKKYDKEREFYRKNLHEKFLTLINKTKNSK